MSRTSSCGRANDQVHLPGPLGELRPSKNLHAGRVRRSAWFGRDQFFSSGFFAPVSSRILPLGDTRTSTSFLSAVSRTTS
jgi:hypothetical protein